MNFYFANTSVDRFTTSYADTSAFDVYVFVDDGNLIFFAVVNPEDILLVIIFIGDREYHLC